MQLEIVPTILGQHISGSWWFVVQTCTFATITVGTNIKLMISTLKSKKTCMVVLAIEPTLWSWCQMFDPRGHQSKRDDNVMWDNRYDIFFYMLICAQLQFVHAISTCLCNKSAPTIAQ